MVGNAKKSLVGGGMGHLQSGGDLAGVEEEGRREIFLPVTYF